MYRGFKLNIDEPAFEPLSVRELSLKNHLINSLNHSTYYDYCYHKGKEIFKKYKTRVRNNLKEYIIGESGIIDGTKLQNDWFPQIDCDIFISHSHKDENLAITLAGWLYDRFHLESFIDSCIWGFADDLLKIIDEEHCKNTNKSYNYKLRNYSTSHVHMMLNMALMQMIDKSECLFFLNTPNSIDLSNIETRTLSPWIYSEIGISQMIEKKRIRAKCFSTLDESLKVSYLLDLSHLQSINHPKLLEWNNCGLIKESALDKLYEMIPAPEKR